MKKKLLFAGLDDHAKTIAIALAEGGVQALMGLRGFALVGAMVLNHLRSRSICSS